MGWGAWGGRRGGGEEETRVRTEVEIAGQGPAARPSSADRFCRATATEREGAAGALYDAVRRGGSTRETFA